jgi:hypothetical protein
MMQRQVIFATTAFAVLAAGTLAAAPKRQAEPATPRQAAVPIPKARYAMDVGTATGFAAMAGGGMRAGMGMMFGGSSKEAKEIRLRLGSTLTATGAPSADHFFQPAAKMGKSVPLVTPGRAPGSEPGEFQRPKGRLLIYWGCGAHAPKNQPVVIDFAKVAAGQMPPGLYTTRIPADRGPTVSNSTTYGEWPNPKSGKAPQGGSLIGDHRIASTYAPEVKFALSQDYMGPITGQTTPSTDGSVTLSWNSVPSATGYYAWVMGFAMGEGRDGPKDMVWWASSSGREFGGGLFDWLAPNIVQRLISDKTVMPPSQTTCTVPAEVKAAAPDMMMGNLYAYGPEAHFSYPPRPATGPWVLDWTARVRYRSTTSWMLNGPPGMGAPNSGASGSKGCKPSVFGVLTGRGC